MNSIKLSLCIPTYNRPEEFKRMLSGVLPQLNNQVEVVVRDDSQTPETKNIFDMFQYTNDIRANVLIEMKEPRAQIIKARFTIAGFNQSIFRAFAPAEFEKVAVKALLWQSVSLVHPKSFLFS